MNPPHVIGDYHRAITRWTLSVAMAGFGVICAAMAMSSDSSGFGQETAARLGVALLGIVCAYLTFRASRLGIVASDEGVHVANLWTSSFLPWHEISGIDGPKAYGALRHAGITFRAVDGRAITASGYVAGPLDRKGFADSAVTELRSQLTQYGADGRS